MDTSVKVISNAILTIAIDSIIWLNREFMPFLPTTGSVYRGPVDAPVYKEEAPDGWWEQKASEHFFAVESISRMMRVMRHSNPNHYTPFTGLCIFTATLMNLYAVTFPAMSRGSSSEKSETLLSENVDDLNRFGKLWKMGQGLIDVVGVMRKVYDRVVNHEARLATHSRDGYAILEKTINLAQDHEIQVSELAAEASPAEIRVNGSREVGNNSQAPTTHDQHPPNDTSNVLEGDFGRDLDFALIFPATLPAALDEDVWRDFVFFQDV
jgi:hypothetical protein